MAVLDRRPVEHRERAGQAQADRADIGVGLGAEAVSAAAEELGGGTQLGVHLEADHRLPLGRGGSHWAPPEARSRWQAEVRGGGLQCRRHLEHDGLAERGREHLHPDGQPVVAGAEGNADGRVAGQVGRDGAHVVEVHGEGIGGLGAEREGGGRRGRGQQDVEVLVGGLEVSDDQGPDLLRLAVVGVVVARPTGRTSRA